MRLIRAILILLVALGASLPACARTGCDTAPAGIAMAHHVAAGHRRPAPAPADHHAVACVGCIAALPEAPSAAPLLAVRAPAPVAGPSPILDDRGPTALSPPPRPA